MLVAPRDPEERPEALGLARILLLIICALAVIYTLYFGRAVIVPFLLAILLALLLRPPTDLLARGHVPRPLAALIVIVCLFGGLTLLIVALTGPAGEWVAQVPHRMPQIQARLEFLYHPFKQFMGMLQQVEKMLPSAPAPYEAVAVQGSGLSSILAASTTSILSDFGTVVLLLFFLLSAGDTLRRRLIEVLPRLSDKKRALEIMHEIEDGISSYLIAITAINAAVGVVTGLAFWATGMGAPILWGTLAFALNFVPIVGPLCGIAIFSMAGLLSFSSHLHGALPVACYIVVILIEGQAVTPHVLAQRFQLNAVAIVASLVIWFWMWGIAGALLAVPLVATFKIICDHIRPLAPIGHLLEG